MSKEVQNTENKEMFYKGFDDESVRVIRNLFDPSQKLNDHQIKLFLHVATEKNLDPMQKQICAIPKHNKHTGKTECVIITQIDGFRLIAERTGRYAPGRETKFDYDKKGSLISATAYVKKLTLDGTWHEVAETAHMREYYANTFAWNNMPHVMLPKCAESRALRRSFPGEFSGLYSKEEMDQATTTESTNEYDVEVEEEKEEDEKISNQEVEELVFMLDGHEDITEKVMNYVSSQGGDKLRDIKKQDLDRVKKSIRKCLKKKAEEKEKVEIFREDQYEEVQHAAAN